MRSVIREILQIVLLALVVFSPGCTREAVRRNEQPPTESPPSLISGMDVPAQQFGRARVALGMTKQEVLEQIRLSREQYDSLEDERSAELVADQPSETMKQSDTWRLTCPTRNSRFLGGGGGIILRLKFREDRVVRIVRFPWPAG